MKEAGVEDQRPAVGDARLQDDVGLQVVEDLLRAKHVLRQLDDGAAQPAEGIDVLRLPSAAEPGLRKERKTPGGVDWMPTRAAVGLVGEVTSLEVDDESVCHDD